MKGLDLDALLAELRQRVDLPALVGRTVALRRSGRAWLGRCPFHDDRSPSLAVWGAPRPGWRCFGCGRAGDAVGWLTAQGWSFREAISRLAAEHGLSLDAWAAHPGGRRIVEAKSAVSAAPAAPDRASATRAVALRVWEAARPLREGDAVLRYLAGRGLAPPPEPVLRHHPALAPPHGQRGRYPAMVALVTGPDGAPCAIHRTFLDPDDARGDGVVRKARGLDSAKAMLGPVHGGTVRLFAEAEHLGLAEGIETALAAAALSGLPVWAALSAGGLEAAVLPFGVARVTIFADRDPSERGLQAAHRAAARFVREGRQAEIALPRGEAKDFADVLARRPHECAA